MEELIGVYKKLRPYKWTGEGREGTDRLKSRIGDAPYVINVVEGSITALQHDSAIPYLYEGDESLVISTAEEGGRTSLIEQLKRDELVSTGVQLSLTNARKDTYHVTLQEAIRFFNSYENAGVDINKVSTNGNSRGFYRVEALKVISRGLGLRLPTEVTKGDYVEAIQLFHTTYEKEIAADKEASRLQITLREELNIGSGIEEVE